MTNSIDTTENEMNLKVVYVLYLGKNSDGKNVYHFLISDDEDKIWGEDWNDKPAANCRFLTPEKEMYDYVKELKTDIILDLAQDNTYYSMADCKDKIIALAYEDISTYEEYPEPVRIVIHFGDSLEDVERMLGQRDLSMTFI